MRAVNDPRTEVSVLFNEPKLLKFWLNHAQPVKTASGFSALQRAEIAEIDAGTIASASS